MKGNMIAACFAVLIFSAIPAIASQTAVIPAYAYVSMKKSEMQAYLDFINDQNRVAAKKLVHSDKVFRSQKDIRVEIVKVDREIAKVKMNRLDNNAKPVTLFFWTITHQLIMLP